MNERKIYRDYVMEFISRREEEGGFGLQDCQPKHRKLRTDYPVGAGRVCTHQRAGGMGLVVKESLNMVLGSSAMETIENIRIIKTRFCKREVEHNLTRIKLVMCLPVCSSVCSFVCSPFA